MGKCFGSPPLVGDGEGVQILAKRPFWIRVFLIS